MNGAMTPPLKFDEIQITDPSSQANGVLSARIDTRIKLCVSFHSGSPVQSLTIPKTPSVHEVLTEPEESLRFSLEARVTAGGSIIANVCSKCRNRKDQATGDIVDFRAETTVVTIKNRTASVEFFIKCYASHHGLDNHAFCIDAILRDRQNTEVDRTALPVRINISGKVKKLVGLTNPRRRAARGVPDQQHSGIPAVPHSGPPLAWDFQHGDDSTVQGRLTSHVGIFPGNNQQPNQQPPGVDATTGVLPAADPPFDYIFPMPVNAPLGMMSNSQLAVQLAELGFSSRNIGSFSGLDSLPLENNINPDVVCSTRTIPSQHDEPVIPTVSSGNAPLLHSLASTSGEPQREHCINQSTSQISSQDSSRGPGAPNTHLGVSSGQGSSGPDRTIPSEASGSQIEAPARTRDEGTNRIAIETLLEEVDPEKGPMTGGIRVAIFGENFPEIPLYVWFGDNWVRARRRDARTLRCRLPPSARAGVMNVKLSRTSSSSAPEVGWSTATFEYEDSRVEALLLILKTIYQRADETALQLRLAQSLATMTTHPNPGLNTNSTHSHNQEREAIAPRLEEVNLEEISIHFLCTYSTHPNWTEIISSCNDYGQTMAHISVTLGYFRLLQRLFTWEIDLDVVDHMGLTALHYAYRFGQEECAGFLIHSGATADNLGRSGSSLDPSLEVRVHPAIDTGGDGSTHSNSSGDYSIAEAEGQYAKHFLVEQWRRQIENERRGEIPLSRHQSGDARGRLGSASTPPAHDSADERVEGVMHGQHFSPSVQLPQEIPKDITLQEMKPPTKTAVPSSVLPSVVAASTQMKLYSPGHVAAQGYRALSGDKFVPYPPWVRQSDQLSTATYSPYDLHSYTPSTTGGSRSTLFDWSHPTSLTDTRPLQKLASSNSHLTSTGTMDMPSPNIQVHAGFMFPRSPPATASYQVPLFPHPPSRYATDDSMDWNYSMNAPAAPNRMQEPPLDSRHNHLPGPEVHQTYQGLRLQAALKDPRNQQTTAPVKIRREKKVVIELALHSDTDPFSHWGWEAIEIPQTGSVKPTPHTFSGKHLKLSTQVLACSAGVLNAQPCNNCWEREQRSIDPNLNLQPYMVNFRAESRIIALSRPLYGDDKCLKVEITFYFTCYSKHQGGMYGLVIKLHDKTGNLVAHCLLPYKFIVYANANDNGTGLHRLAPAEGPMSGGRTILLSGINFPHPSQQMVYAKFGSVVVTTIWHNQHTLECMLPPSPTPGTVRVTLSIYQEPGAPEFGQSHGLFKYIPDHNCISVFLRTILGQEHNLAPETLDALVPWFLQNVSPAGRAFLHQQLNAPQTNQSFSFYGDGNGVHESRVHIEPRQQTLLPGFPGPNTPSVPVLEHRTPELLTNVHPVSVNQHSYFDPNYPASVLHRLAPAEGPTSGGQTILLSGTNFPHPSQRMVYAKFGSVVVTTIWHNQHTLECKLPPSPTPGTVEVTLSVSHEPGAPGFGQSHGLFKYIPDHNCICVLRTISGQEHNLAPENWDALIPHFLKGVSPVGRAYLYQYSNAPPTNQT